MENRGTRKMDGSGRGMHANRGRGGCSTLRTPRARGRNGRRSMVSQGRNRRY